LHAHFYIGVPGVEPMLHGWLQIVFLLQLPFLFPPDLAGVHKTNAIPLHLQDNPARFWRKRLFACKLTVVQYNPYIRKSSKIHHCKFTVCKVLHFLAAKSSAACLVTLLHTNT
jgi:hypothetical protein